MVYFDENHWLKAGIEIIDDLPRLSCVVTNG
jgi:regulation of enolase protein 1 (concanavalin A-like superfamily)